MATTMPAMSKIVQAAQHAFDEGRDQQRRRSFMRSRFLRRGDESALGDGADAARDGCALEARAPGIPAGMCETSPGMAKFGR